MRLYTLALVVLRDQEGQTEIHLDSAVALFQPGADVDQAALDMVTRTFPAADGWYGHRILLRELPAEGMRLDAYWLTWQLHDVELPMPPAA
jgi:hypothetical protein